MNTKNKKLIILWTLRGLIKKIDGKVFINPKSKTSDLYAILAKGLIDKKIVDQAELIWIDPRAIKKNGYVYPNVKMRIFNSTKEAEKALDKESCEYLFIRGNYSEFSKISNSIVAGFKMFYAADPEYWPTFWPKNYFDLIFVDEKDQVIQGQKKYPKTKVTLLDKPVNTKIFKPQKIKKIYDVCYIGNFIFWKNHQLLFSALEKIKNSHKIKVVCVGRTYNRDNELKIAAWKYHLNIKFINEADQEMVAKIINQSKCGVIVSEKDANPRTINETLACGVPLVVSDNLVGGKRAIKSTTGIISKNQDLPQKIAWMIKNYKKFKPAKYYNKNFNVDKVIKNCFLKNLK